MKHSTYLEFAYVLVNGTSMTFCNLFRLYHTLSNIKLELCCYLFGIAPLKRALIRIQLQRQNKQIDQSYNKNDK